MSDKSSSVVEENIIEEFKELENLDDVGGTIEEKPKKEKKEKPVKEVKVKEPKEEKEKVDKNAEKREGIDRIKEQEKKVYEMLKFDDYENLMSDCYTELDVNIQMVIDGIGYGCIVEGKGGTGKTYRVLNQCVKALGNEEVIYTDSFTTPTALYVTLYENRDKKLIILDDCADLMNNAKILAMLKGGLWHINDGKTRIINYNTTKPPKDEYGDDLPRSFELTAHLIIITNHINEDNPHVKAVLSRVNKVLVEVPRKELLNILKQVIKKEYHNLTLAEREEVLGYLEENTNNQTEELNIRSLLRMMDYKVWAKKHNRADAWKVLCLKLLQRDSRIALVEKIMEDPAYPSPDEKWMRFVELTGESRATYYRLAKKVGKRKKDIDEALKK